MAACVRARRICSRISSTSRNVSHQADRRLVALPHRGAEERQAVATVRKHTAVDPRVKTLEQENRRLTSRLQQAEAVIAFQKKLPNSWGSR
jgi:hypothetical protein